MEIRLYEYILYFYFYFEWVGLFSKRSGMQLILTRHTRFPAGLSRAEVWYHSEAVVESVSLFRRSTEFLTRVTVMPSFAFTRGLSILRPSGGLSCQVHERSQVNAAYADCAVLTMKWVGFTDLNQSAWWENIRIEEEEVSLHVQYT